MRYFLEMKESPKRNIKLDKTYDIIVSELSIFLNNHNNENNITMKPTTRHKYRVDFIYFSLLRKSSSVNLPIINLVGLNIAQTTKNTPVIIVKINKKNSI